MMITLFYKLVAFSELALYETVEPAVPEGAAE